MTEFKDTQRELYIFRLRLVAGMLFVLICFGLLVARYLTLQIVRHDNYAARADENRISLVPIAPNRGIVTDRKGVVLARNYSAYTLEITPSKVANIDATIEELSQVIPIEQRDRRRFKKLLEETKTFEGIPIRTRLSEEEIARFVGQRYRFPGVEVQARLFRQYPLGDSAAHVIGYIGRVSEKDLDRLEEQEEKEGVDLLTNYQGTDYIGKEGLEKKYEPQLHGTTGAEEVEVTASGRAVRTLSRTPALSGDNLVLSIDIKLQQLVEEAFGDRRGALVAIEPSTGDILAFVSRPSFDPNLFVEGIDAENWRALNESIDKPLINRPLAGTYPPGSTFKAVPGARGGSRTASARRSRRSSIPVTSTTATTAFATTRRRPRHRRHVQVDRRVVRHLLLHAGRRHADRHDGQLPAAVRLRPDHRHRPRRRAARRAAVDRVEEASPSRKSSSSAGFRATTISIGIGQGYNAYTPLQLAHAVATLANDGVVMQPHLVKEIESARTGQRTPTVPSESFRIKLQQKNIDFVRNAMVGVNTSGNRRGPRSRARSTRRAARPARRSCSRSSRTRSTRTRTCRSA